MLKGSPAARFIYTSLFTTAYDIILSLYSIYNQVCPPDYFFFPEIVYEVSKI